MDHQKKGKLPKKNMVYRVHDPIPPPVIAPVRDPTLLPFNSPGIQKEMEDHARGPRYLLKPVLGLVLCAICYFVSELDVDHLLFHSLSLIFGAYSVVYIVVQLVIRSSALLQKPTQVTKEIELFEEINKNPSEKFMKDAPTIGALSDGIFDSTGSIIPSMSLFRPYVVADRATSAISRSFLAGQSDTSIDQLAVDTLNRLGISSSDFNQYLMNLKSHIGKALLEKLAPKVRTDDPMITLMLTVPTFDHCQEYIIQRIETLANSQFLAGHFGDKGDNWHDREWTSELPSDNQIVLHLLGCWISFFMAGGRNPTKVQNIFKVKHVSLRKEPHIDKSSDIYLCYDEKAAYYILAHNNSGPERFWTPPGHDSMYAALTLFFWFVKEKYGGSLDGTDLSEQPISMDRVITRVRYETN